MVDPVVPPQVHEYERQEPQIPPRPPAARETEHPEMRQPEMQQPDKEQRQLAHPEHELGQNPPRADGPNSVFSSALRNALAQAARRAEIRAEAVRLACIATGRILRHAVAFDANVVARFVDDALAAAQDEHAIVRVNGAHRGALVARGPQCVPDERTDAGAVAVELPAGGVAATLEQRAELIVRAIGAD